MGQASWWTYVTLCAGGAELAEAVLSVGGDELTGHRESHPVGHVLHRLHRGRRGGLPQQQVVVDPGTSRSMSVNTRRRERVNEQRGSELGLRHVSFSYRNRDTRICDIRIAGHAVLKRIDDSSPREIYPI